MPEILVEKPVFTQPASFLEHQLEILNIYTKNHYVSQLTETVLLSFGEKMINLEVKRNSNSIFFTSKRTMLSLMNNFILSSLAT
jgi:hypothetical protein